jgi:hypothetical protein
MPIDLTNAMPGGWTPIPNDFLDRIAPTLTAAELRVALYIYRHTIGYQKLTDAISYSQFTEGVTTADGHKLDTGAGVSRRSLPAALAGLERRGVISRSGGGIGGAVRYTIAQPKAKAVNKLPEPEEDSGAEPEQPAAPVEAPKPVPGQKLLTSQSLPGQNLPASAPKLGQILPPTIETDSKIKPDRAAAVILIIQEIAGISTNQAEKLVGVAMRNQRDISYISRLVGYVTSVAGNPAAMLTVLINRNEDRTTGPSQPTQEAGAIRYMNRQKSNNALPRRQQPIDFSKPIYQRFIDQGNLTSPSHSNTNEHFETVQ